MCEILEALAGPQLFGQLKDALDGWDLARANKDLGRLSRLLSPQELKTHYVQPLLHDCEGTIAEIFAVARAARNATHVLPHCPGPGRKNFDALLTFGSDPVAIEVKHQRDQFPFNTAPVDVEGMKLYSGQRPGADPRYLGQSVPPEMTQSLPGSDIWRATLLEAATQLPRTIPTIAVVSADASGGLDLDVVDALCGDSTMVGRLYEDGTHDTREERLGNGAFAQDAFVHVSAVYFFRLSADGEEMEQRGMTCNWARGALNPRAHYSQLPDSITFALPNVYERPPRRNAGT